MPLVWVAADLARPYSVVPCLGKPHHCFCLSISPGWEEGGWALGIGGAGLTGGGGVKAWGAPGRTPGAVEGLVSGTKRGKVRVGCSSLPLTKRVRRSQGGCWNAGRLKGEASPLLVHEPVPGGKAGAAPCRSRPSLRNIFFWCLTGLLFPCLPLSPNK